MKYSSPAMTAEVLGVLCRLDVYIYDYLIKRNLQASAKAFLNEGKVSSDPVGMFFFSVSFVDMKIPLRLRMIL
jgi:hypothetical protein